MPPDRRNIRRSPTPADPFPPFSRPSLPLPRLPLASADASASSSPLQLPALPLSRRILPSLPDGTGHEATPPQTSLKARTRLRPDKNLAATGGSRPVPSVPEPGPRHDLIFDHGNSGLLPDFGGDDGPLDFDVGLWDDNVASMDQNGYGASDSTLDQTQARALDAAAHGEPGSDELQDYGRMLFDEHCALVVRLDTGTWVLESTRGGSPQFGVFYHLSLYRIYNERHEEELLTSCDCPSRRAGSMCIHQDAGKTFATKMLSMTPLS
ncbi:hypothetical protein V8E36_003712, partial [Tilletia maclaganii]